MDPFDRPIVGEGLLGPLVAFVAALAAKPDKARDGLEEWLDVSLSLLKNVSRTKRTKNEERRTKKKTKQKNEEKRR